MARLAHNDGNPSHFCPPAHPPTHGTHLLACLNPTFARPLNLDTLESWVQEGRLDPSRVITMRELRESNAGERACVRVWRACPQLAVASRRRPPPSPTPTQSATTALTVPRCSGPPDGVGGQAAVEGGQALLHAAAH